MKKMFLTITVLLVFNVAAFGYTPPDCDGCTSITPGYQYETYDGHCLYIENWRCDLEGAVNVTSGDDDSSYGIDMGYYSLDACDGYWDDATLTYNERWGNQYSINLGFGVEGLTIGTSVTASYEQSNGVTKPVDCPPCKYGDVTARSVRKHASVVVTVISYRRYDHTVRTKTITGFCAEYPSFYPIVRQNAYSILCETSTYTTSGYVYGMEFNEDFEWCPDEDGCPCEEME